MGVKQTSYPQAPPHSVFHTFLYLPDLFWRFGQLNEQEPHQRAGCLPPESA